ncbi:hypothetical protein TVAG_472570 [Trichomonas vaginalis G3]|uniref:Transmembrane 9 superfamily member n=1 Tax=Trichomonas vaginalis (strain ATCC PRA-98 / G3) TaxID=412133 RepID=A2FU84_TRIV3|nr:positive regulation of protein exit from endoplasmic reticulum [Trichomonas vaginalis G3]EAX91515.1 hypothetical protein TVAG_472570 [Trichomonas vaginalis G3]KAI5537957.1 positive regulation of protein exit from endoplasmic reticulum [Trichomonas vaginalis G3]|eukprot:XP_001304445.1 hypothetical protein [Trichomonas vaginalis G3]
MENYPFEMFAGSLVSSKVSHPLPYSIGDLFCLPNDLTVTHGLTDQIIGQQITSTPYKFNMHKSIKCKLICKRKYTQEQKELLYYLIDNHYKIRYYTDSLPAYVDVSTTEGVSQNIYGVDIGFREPPNIPHNLTANAHYISTHLNITVHLFKDFALGINYIMGISLIPISQPNPPPCTFDYPDSIENTTEFFWTYSINFDYVDEKPNDRWKLTVANSFTHSIKWAFIINVIIGVFLASLLFYIFFLQYIRQQSATASTVTGWKALRNDVFRPPSHPLIWSAFIAHGIHLVLVILSVIIPCVLHITSPANPSLLVNIGIWSYLVLSIAEGYLMQYIYASTGANTKKFTILKGSLYAHLSTFALFVLLDCTLTGKPMSTAFITVNKFFLIFIGCLISIFNGAIGSILCMVFHRFKGIADCSAFPREIKPQPFFSEEIKDLLVGFAIFLPLIPVFDLVVKLMWVPYAIWRLWIAILGSITASLLTASCLSMLTTYIRLTKEDYNWWWPSLKAPLMSSLFMFMRSLSPIMTKMDSTFIVPTISMIARSFLASLIFGISVSAVSGIASLFFVVYAFVNRQAPA